MRFIDLTYVLSEETVPFPGKTPFSRKILRYPQGIRLDDINVSAGIGTHMDAPIHVSKGGGIDLIPIAQCNGPACVLHLADKVKGDSDYAISAEDILEWEKINGKIPEESIVLADTGWGQFWGKEKFCFLDKKGVCHLPGFSEAAAKLLAIRKVKGVGIDTMSIDTGNAPKPVAHLALLEENIFLVENMANLEQLPAVGAHVWILPMKIKDASEAPVRAFAVL